MIPGRESKTPLQRSFRLSPACYHDSRASAPPESNGKKFADLLIPGTLSDRDDGTRCGCRRSEREITDFWSRCRGSNPRPLPYQGSALPTELQRLAHANRCVSGGQGRIRTFVPRKEGQIYSLLALTTHPPVRSDDMRITQPGEAAYPAQKSQPAEEQSSF